MSVGWGSTGGRERWRCAVCGAEGSETVCRVCGVELWASERLAAVLMRDLGVDALPDTPPLGPSDLALDMLEDQITRGGGCELCRGGSPAGKGGHAEGSRRGRSGGESPVKKGRAGGRRAPAGPRMGSVLIRGQCALST